TGAAQWQVCYANTQPFTAQPGTSGTAVIGGVTFNTGLLLDCSNTQGVPCVQARHKDNAGDVIVTFLASGDPIAWGRSVLVVRWPSGGRESPESFRHAAHCGARRARPGRSE